jgi:hypothetical protein
MFRVHDSSLERYRRGDSFLGINKSLSISLRCSIQKKIHLCPQNGPRSLGTEKTAKNRKLLEDCFEPVGIGGWPPISTWITVTSKL